MALPAVAKVPRRGGGGTEATAGPRPVNDSVHQAYNYYATRDIDRPAGYGSIVQPLVVPYVDNRPIIMPGRYESYNEYHPKYNPFDHQNDSLHRDIRALLGMTQAERDRNKNQMAKDMDDYQRRMRKELEDERRRLQDQENDARRRMEQMRKDLDDRRREWERQMREAQRAKSEKQTEPPKTAPLQIRPPSTTLLSDMDDYRKRLIDERKKIEELLKAQLKQPDYTQVKVLKRPPPPPTPPDSDLANRRVLEEFNHLKHKDKETRKAFRKMYPELPETNIKLETQQRALLREQEDALRSLNKNSQKGNTKMVTYRDGSWSRPGWMDRSLTPFPHRLRQRDRLYTTQSLDGDLDRIYRRAERRELAIDNLSTDYDEYDRLRLRSHRPVSAETLTDDTWMRPASASVL